LFGIPSAFLRIASNVEELAGNFCNDGILGLRAACEDQHPPSIVSCGRRFEQVAAIDDRQLTSQREQTETNDE
jgi:hypothetical protein